MLIYLIVFLGLLTWWLGRRSAGLGVLAGLLSAVVIVIYVALNTTVTVSGTVNLTSATPTVEAISDDNSH